MEKSAYFFIHLPKTAGNSVKEYIKKYQLPVVVVRHHVRWEGYRYPQHLLEPQTTNAFTVVRNPLARVASSFYYLKAGGMNEGDRDDARKFLAEYRTFPEFVEKGLGDEDRRAELKEQVLHFMSMVKFLGRGKLRVVKDNNILRYELLPESFDEFLKREMGKRVEEFPVVNPTPAKEIKKRQNYIPAYDNSMELVEIASDAYWMDMEEFGYEETKIYYADNAEERTLTDGQSGVGFSEKGEGLHVAVGNLQYGISKGDEER